MRSAPEYKQIKYSKSNFKYLCDISALLLKCYIKDLPNMVNAGSIEMAHISVDCFRECLTTAVALYERKFADFLKVLGKIINSFENQFHSIASMIAFFFYSAFNMIDVNTNLITILHNVLDKIIASFENNDVEPEHHGILQKMFQSLELLYNNIALNQDEAILVHNWLYHFCKSHSIDGAEHALVHKLLFTQRIRTQKGDTFVAIAKQIETQLGQINSVRIIFFNQFPI